MTRKVLLLTASVSTMFLLTSCDKDDATDAPTQYTVPDTYSFENAEFSEATVTLNMYQAFTAYLGKGSSRALSQDTVNYLWNNTNGAFTDEIAANLPNTAAQLNTAELNLASATEDAGAIKAFADSMVAVSQFSGSAGNEGVPGKQGNRLFNYSGLEFNQAVAKGLMGALILNNISKHLDASVSADNNTVIEGKGTAMQHEWDLAFGFVGIPTDYDTAKSYERTDPNRPLAVGGYFGERGKFIKAGGTVYEAFRKGRAAIGAKDYATRDAAIATIKEYVEKTFAAACYYYVTHPQAVTERPDQLHELSEGRGFIIALKYRTANSKLSASDYQSLAGILGVEQNAYELIGDASFTKLKEAQQILTSSYGQLQP